MKYTLIIFALSIMGLSVNANAINHTQTTQPVDAASIELSSENAKSVHLENKKTGRKGIVKWFKWGIQKIKKTVYRWLGIEAQNKSSKTLLWASIITFLVGVICLIIAFSGGSGLAAALFSIVLYVVGWVFAVLGLILLIIYAISSAVS